MGEYGVVILLTAVSFCGMILLLAAKPRFASRLTGFCIAMAAVGGLFFYGWGFAATMEHFPIAVIRALLAVCGMFVGKIDYEAVRSSSILQAGWVQFLFWAVHLMALYATASAAIATVGARALKSLRLWLIRWTEVNLVYGVNEESIAFGRALAEQKNGSLVYVGANCGSGQDAAISDNGWVLRMDDSALRADERFLRSIGVRPGRRKIHLYALNRDPAENLGYAENLLRSLEKRGIRPEQTVLVMLGHEDFDVSALQVLGTQYGYGSVTVFQEAGLAARLLVHQFPPCDTIAFDGDCRATEDFEALIVGFGRVGQAVLRNLVMNSQFTGSHFHAAVFAPDCQSTGGYFSDSCRQVLEHYDITFYPYDARSPQMYDYLLQNGNRIKYVVACAGTEKLNREIGDNLLEYFQRMDRQIPVYQVSGSGVLSRNPNDRGNQEFPLYQPQVLSMHQVDRMAMILNHHYQAHSEQSALEDWMQCDYFSRMSSRASADFLRAVLRAAGRSKEQAAAGDWHFSEVQLENLGRMEHLRWSAFHYCMGFSPMSPEEYADRTKQYRQGRTDLRIGKNMKRRTHACLIPWEELDALSAREESITGKAVDYKALDIANVLAVPELLRAGMKEGAV